MFPIACTYSPLRGFFRYQVSITTKLCHVTIQMTKIEYLKCEYHILKILVRFLRYFWVQPVIGKNSCNQFSYYSLVLSKCFKNIIEKWCKLEGARWEKWYNGPIVLCYYSIMNKKSICMENYEYLEVLTWFRFER